MTELAAVVWNDGRPLELPRSMDLVEDLDPVPVSVVAASARELELLKERGLAVSAAPVSNDELAMVRSVASCLRVNAQLRLRAVNGYPGRLPPDCAGQTPAYPVLDDAPEIQTDPDVMRIHPMAIPSALNLSQAPPSPLESVDQDGATTPLAAALRVAADDMPVVVAAGRAREGVGELSSIARLPWTIAVGATEPDGTTLSPGSPRGSSDGDGPFVCANKYSDHERPRAGTSFAAPRVARELVVLAGFFRTFAQVLDDNGVDGVSLGTLAIVDEGQPDPERLARLAIPSYPLGAGVGQEAVRVLAALEPSVAGRLGDHRTWVKALARSARSMPAYGPREVGHGFVSRDTTLDYLGALTLRDVLELVDHVAEPAAGSLETPVADDRLERAADVWARAAVVVYADYRSDSCEMF